MTEWRGESGSEAGVTILEGGGWTEQEGLRRRPKTTEEEKGLSSVFMT